jgi:hypothetical protein
VPLGPSGFGAVRVLRAVRERGKDTALVAVTPWLGREVPDIHEPQLREILRKHFGRWDGSIALCWYQGTAPPDLLWIGTIAPTDEELAIDPKGAYCGVWSLAVAHDVLRERGLPVEHVPSVVRGDDVDRVTGVMSDDDFWHAIALIDLDADRGDDVLAALLDHLTGLPPASIAGFHRRLCDKLFELDAEAFAGETRDYFSPDHFLDVRCAAVARGKRFYEALLNDPSMMPHDTELEALLTVAEDAYLDKTGRDVVFLGAQPYETFSNRAGWPASDD